VFCGRLAAAGEPSRVFPKVSPWVFPDKGVSASFSVTPQPKHGRAFAAAATSMLRRALHSRNPVKTPLMVQWAPAAPGSGRWELRKMTGEKRYNNGQSWWRAALPRTSPPHLAQGAPSKRPGPLCVAVPDQRPPCPDAVVAAEKPRPLVGRQNTSATKAEKQRPGSGPKDGPREESTDSEGTPVRAQNRGQKMASLFRPWLTNCQNLDSKNLGAPRKRPSASWSVHSAWAIWPPLRRGRPCARELSSSCTNAPV